MTLKRLKNLFFLHLANLPVKSLYIRPLLAKWGGVRVKNPKSVFIGRDVIFDTNHPELITLEDGVRVTARCIILTHIKDSNTGKYTFQPVTLKKNAFLGCNSVICKSVVIGENAIIGASSVVTKDIPANEVWAGNPARFIRKRDI